MYQIDEKIMASNRALICLSSSMAAVDQKLKAGMQVYDMLFKDTYAITSEEKYSRFIQEDAVSKKIHYDLNFAGNITIDKNLVVKGAVTNLETQDLLIKDNLIQINKDEVGDGISNVFSGIEINRGIRPKAKIIYSEITDVSGKTGFSLMSGEISLINIYEDGDLKTLKNIDTKNLSVNNDALIYGKLTANGVAALKSSLSVTGATDIASTLSVAGNTTLKSDTRINENLTIDKTLTATGATAIDNTLLVNQKATLNNGLDVTGQTTLKGFLTANEDSTFLKTITSNGAVSLKNTLTVDMAATLKGALGVTGIASFSSDASITGNLSVAGVTGITGQLNTSSIVNTGNFKTLNSEITNDISVARNASVTGNLSVTGTTTANEDIIAIKNISTQGELSVVGLSTLQDIIANKAVLMKNTLSVMEAVTFEKASLTKGIASFDNNVNVKLNLDVLGNSTFKKATVVQIDTGILNVSGKATFNSDATFNFPIVSKNIIFSKAVEDGIKWRLGVEEIYSSINISEDITIFNPVKAYNMKYKTASDNEAHIFTTGTTPVFMISKTGVKSLNDISVKRGEVWSNLLCDADNHKANHIIGGHDAISPSDIGAVKNSAGVSEISSGLDASKPIAGIKGRIYISEDKKRFLRDTGTAWEVVGGEPTIPWTEVTGKPITFTPPMASATLLGGIKIGSGIERLEDGTINVPRLLAEYTIRYHNITSTDGQTAFIIPDGYIVGMNLVSIYVFGRRLSPTAFIETNNTTITVKEALPAGTQVDFYITNFSNDISPIIKIEEFISRADQTVFSLSQGKYRVGENKAKVYVNGKMMSPSSFTETSDTEITMKAIQELNSLVMIEYTHNPLVL